MFRYITCFLACLFLLVPYPARADLREQTAALFSAGQAADHPPDRSPASAAAQQGADYLEQQARQLTAGSNAAVLRQSFLITLPVVDVGEFSLILPSAPSIPPATQPATRFATSATQPAASSPAIQKLPLYPLLPMGGQPPVLGSADGPATLPLVYAHFGRLSELAGKAIARHAVVLELDAPEGSAAWERCAALGASAIIFLGNPTLTTPAFLDKSTSLPLAIPRFYCDDPATVALLRAPPAGAELSAHLRVSWQEKIVDNVLCFIPAAGAGYSGPATTDRPDQWLILQSRYDAPSQILSRAPGATTALNAAALLDMADAIAHAPAHGAALLAWTAGEEWNFRGTRALLDLLHRGLRDPTQVLPYLNRQVDEARAQLATATAIAASARRIADAGWSPTLSLTPETRDALEEQLLRRSSEIEERIEHARLSTLPISDRVPSRSDKQPLLAAISVVNGQNAAAPAEPVRRALQDAAAQVAARWQKEQSRRQSALTAISNWPATRAALPLHDPTLLISFNLTAAQAFQARSGAAPFLPRYFGLLARSDYSAGLDVAGKMSPFAQAFRRYAQPDGAAPAAAPAPRFFPDSMGSRFALEALLPIKLGFPSDAAIARGLPAFAAVTLHDPSTFLDTPNDTPDAIAWPDAVAQEQSLLHLLLGTKIKPGQLGITLGAAPTPGALTDPFFYGRSSLPVEVADQTVTLYQRALGESLPRLKADGALLGGESEIYSHPLGDPLAGTRRTEWYLTHADGTAVFTSALRAQEAEIRLQAFQFDAAGNVRRALAANQSDVAGMVSTVAPNAGRPVRALLFEAQRFDAYGLFDPRYLGALDQLQVLDARRLDAAQFSNVYARGGLAAIFLPPTDSSRFQLLASRGNVGNRLILINADAQHPNGQGFDTTDLARIGPLPWRAARDFFTLDSQRKADLERFGISNEIIRELQSASERQLALAQTAETRRDYPTFFAAADALWGLQSQEYQDLIDTSNGIIKGVIFLLLGVIPFSYFLERLVIGAVNVYRQIAWFALIFACMTAGLWFHPAFRISTAPVMILLAFLILILSSTVVYILWGKFDEEISRLRHAAVGGGGGASGHVASFRRGAVLGAAVRLGLSNMRRRGMRTALTLFTLVLLTFTLLCFTSVRETVQISPQPVAYWSTAAPGSLNASKRQMPLPVPPAGILLRQRGWQELPDETLQFARGLALPREITLASANPGFPPQSAPAASAPAPAQGPVARRYWYASQRAEQPWLLPVQAHDKTYTVNGLVGLDPAEAQFQPALDSVLPNFIALNALPPQSPTAAIPLCWLPAEARDTLGLKPGEVLSILGYRLQVAGFFDPVAFAQLRQLTGDPLSPLDPSGTQSLSGNGPANTPDLVGPSRAESSYRFLDSISVAIVPAWLTAQLGGRLTSIALRPAGMADRPTADAAATLDRVATSLARRSAFTIYVSDGHRVLSINSSESSRPQDLGTVLIPMLIAGVIVLNTMLGAVSERSREIHVYTSVGLSPAHVGMLFLAEAAALGTLGVVFGYIFGQGLATILSATHWLPGVDLNYSSMSAIVTMGLVLGTVMLSALWPARAAARLATPSLQRDWKLPRPVNDMLAVDLPFTVNETAAKGVCAFLAEFLSSTSTAGTGRFTADHIAAISQPSTQGPVRTLSARIWLAPYDLGVIQAMRLSIHPAEPVSGAGENGGGRSAMGGVYDVHVQLTREAGNPSAWRRLNRPFLVEIRKQFLLWRALDPARTAHYIERSETLFQS